GTLYILFSFSANQSEIALRSLTKQSRRPTLGSLFRPGVGRHADVSPYFFEGGGGVGRRGWNGPVRSFKGPGRDARAEDFSHHRNPKYLPILLGLLRRDHPHARRQSEKRDTRGGTRRRRSRSSD